MIPALLIQTVSGGAGFLEGKWCYHEASLFNLSSARFIHGSNCLRKEENWGNIALLKWTIIHFVSVAKSQILLLRLIQHFLVVWQLWPDVKQSSVQQISEIDQWEASISEIDQWETSKTKLSTANIRDWKTLEPGINRILRAQGNGSQTSKSS